MAHARIGPSALARIIACPGSVWLSEQAEKAMPGGGGSAAASQGTVAHALAEDALANGVAPEERLGETITCENIDILVDQEMVDGVYVYLNTVTPLQTKRGVMSGVESKVSLDKLWSPDPAPEPIFGTVDFWSFCPSEGKLTVADLKFGRIGVSPYDNPQALAYALGVAFILSKWPVTVEIIIVQPRGMNGAEGAVKRWTITGLDLAMWGYDVLKPAVEAATVEGAPLRPGEAQCRFCSAKALCPALTAEAKARVRQAFGSRSVPSDPSSASPAGLTDAELGDVLDDAEALASWIAAVRAEASRRLDAGGKVPGYKLVPKRAMRRWAHEDAVRQMIAACHSTPDMFYAPGKLLSPTQVEKADETMYETLVKEGFVDATSSGTTLVRDADERDAVAFPTTKQAFGDNPV